MHYEATVSARVDCGGKPTAQGWVLISMEADGDIGFAESRVISRLRHGYRAILWAA